MHKRIGVYIDRSADPYDSSALLVRECVRRGHRLALFDAVDSVSGTIVDFSDGATHHLSSFDGLLLRKDPPVDLVLMSYLGSAGGLPPMVNDPLIISLDRKDYMKDFAQFMPLTYYPMSADAALDAVYSLGKAVVKPIDGFGGSGISVVDASVHDARYIEGRIAAAWSDEGVVVQQYLEESVAGDKRVLVLQGEPLGAFLRVPGSRDGLCNLHAGGRSLPCSISSYERQVVAAVAPKILSDGGYFVGLDFIGPYLTECNSTSPGGLARIIAFSGDDCLVGRVVDMLESRF